MDQKFDLEQYLNSNVDSIIKNALKAAFRNPRQAAFLARYAVAASKAKRRRATMAKQGEHIPPFLIASITSQCNLHCQGCYARANHSCGDTASHSGLTAAEWVRIFKEASALGISFILLAGGEPLMRKDVLEQAAGNPGILFPVFTNGTMIDSQYLSLFDANRNLVPILSIEGNEQITDQRRGSGVYLKLMDTMGNLQSKGIFYGTSITVTKQNLFHVTSDEFLSGLQKKECKVVIYVEYVPVDSAAKDTAPSDEERTYLNDRLNTLRAAGKEMVLISFPGDESSSGGCLAAGRGFFHINAHGGAEPCPFSPYSDTNLREKSLREALRSPLFMRLSSGDMLLQSHTGGCVLFEQEQKVIELLNG